MLVEQMRQRGRRKIAYLIHWDPDFRHEKIREKTMREMDRKYADIQCISLKVHCTRSAHGCYIFHDLAKVLKENPDLDGLILNLYRDQPGVLEELLKLGLTVPEDISLLSFFAPQVGPARLAIDPTGINIDGEELATVMGEMLDIVANGGETEPCSMSYRWIDGASF